MSTFLDDTEEKAVPEKAPGNLLQKGIEPMSSADLSLSPDSLPVSSENLIAA